MLFKFCRNQMNQMMADYVLAYMHSCLGPEKLKPHQHRKVHCRKHTATKHTQSLICLYIAIEVQYLKMCYTVVWCQAPSTGR